MTNLKQRLHLYGKPQVKYPLLQALSKCFKALPRYIAEPVYVKIYLEVIRTLHRNMMLVRIVLIHASKWLKTTKVAPASHSRTHVIFFKYKGGLYYFRIPCRSYVAGEKALVFHYMH